MNYNPTIPKGLIRKLTENPKALVGTSWSNVHRYEVLKVVGIDNNDAFMVDTSLYRSLVPTPHILNEFSGLVYEGMDVNWASPGSIVTAYETATQPETVCYVVDWGFYLALAKYPYGEPVSKPYGFTYGYGIIRNRVRRASTEEQNAPGVLANLHNVLIPHLRQTSTLEASLFIPSPKGRRTRTDLLLAADPLEEGPEDGQ